MTKPKELHLKISTLLEDEDGDANLTLEIYDTGGVASPIFIGGLAFRPMEAHTFGLNIMNTALKMEIYSALIMVMRSHKIQEETIDEIIDDADGILFARRHSG